MARRKPTLRRNLNKWEPYDPRWLVHLARQQFPGDYELHQAPSLCTLAQRNACCAPKICGYHFVDASNPNQPGSPWQHSHTVIIPRDAEPDIFVDVLKDGRIGAVEFF